LLAQNEGGFVPASHPKPWQEAGIRAAFGDARSPNPELSPDAQREGPRLCVAHGWGEALDPREAAVYLSAKDATLRDSAAWALGRAAVGATPQFRDAPGPDAFCEILLMAK
jgi:hypothetical protein